MRVGSSSVPEGTLSSVLMVRVRSKKKEDSDPCFL